MEGILSIIIQLNYTTFCPFCQCLLSHLRDFLFAKSFGKMAMPDCHYLLVTRNEKRTAAERAYMVRKIADQMDKRQRRLELEKWIPINIRFY